MREAGGVIDDDAARRRGDRGVDVGHLRARREQAEIHALEIEAFERADLEHPPVTERDLAPRRPVRGQRHDLIGGEIALGKEGEYLTPHIACGARHRDPISHGSPPRAFRATRTGRRTADGPRIRPFRRVLALLSLGTQRRAQPRIALCRLQPRHRARHSRGGNGGLAAPRGGCHLRLCVRLVRPFLRRTQPPGDLRLSAVVVHTPTTGCLPSPRRGACAASSNATASRGKRLKRRDNGVAHRGGRYFRHPFLHDVGGAQPSASTRDTAFSTRSASAARSKE